MDYKDFVEQVKEQIKDFLPEKFADAEVTVDRIVKNNDCILDGLMIRTEESNIFPTIYLNPYFEQVKDGAEFGSVLSMIAAAYEEHYVDHDIDASAVTDYERIKDKIVCKLINGEANEHFLKDKPHTQIEDLAVVYQILMNQDEGGTAVITIPDYLLKIYGVTTEELHQQALANMEALQPFSFMSMNEIMLEVYAAGLAQEQGMDMEQAKEMAAQMISDAPDIPDAMYVLTNNTKINGASEILSDDVRQEIADKIGDFFVLPSSIHEILIIPKNAGMDQKELEQMVQEVNRTQVLPEERLSDHVYEYDAKAHELFRSDRTAERQKEKMQERPSLKDRLAEKQNAAAEMDKGRKQPSSEKKKESAIE